ncbi:MAG: hypothetical protein HGA22_13150 [Clostridiales bacterium]|nr:hypothetical protein [Clostridiales bacterium]
MDLYSYRRHNSSKALLIVVAIAAALISGAGVYYWQAYKYGGAQTVNEVKEPATVKNTRMLIQEKGDAVLLALKSNDMALLSSYVNPVSGVRLTPYSYVDAAKDITIKSNELAGLSSDTAKRIWGSYDGSGEPISLTFSEYLAKFIYDKDFLSAPQIIFNEEIQRGNSIVNVSEAYPGCLFIEYYFPGFDTQYEGMDWESLTLVFEQNGREFYLTGIIHNKWTI